MKRKKVSTLTSGILVLGMSLMMGNAVAGVPSQASSRPNEGMEQPPVVEVVTSSHNQMQAESQRSAVWYRQMRHQMRPAETGTKPAAKETENQALFSCTFESAEDFAAKWNTTDGDGDGKTWRFVSGKEYAAFDGDTANYVKSTSIDDWDEELSTTVTADAMVTKSAVALQAGKAYVAFKYIFDDNMPVQLKVYYGKAADPAQMTLIGQLNGKDKGEGPWKDTMMAFTVADAGDYYFCFLNCTEDEWKMNATPIYISKVEIHAGEVPGGGDEPGVDDPVEPTVATPVFSRASGEVEAGTKVGISCATEGAVIYYTTDGGEPTDLADEYGDSIIIDKAMTIKAIAMINEGESKSEVAQVSFTIKNGGTGGDEPGGDDEPGQTLFVCTFESAEDFAAKWTVSDHDGDNKTWRYVTGHDTYYPGLDGSFGNGYAQSVTIYEEDNPDIETADHMMTKAAIHMPAGKAYVAFNYTLGSWNPVHLKLYYSKTPDAELSDMTLVGEVKKSEKDFDKNEEAWRDTAIALTLAEAGDYYFCFVHCSKPDDFGMNLNGLYIDNIIIGTGRYAPTPELKVEHVLLPLSSCALGTEEPVFVRLRSVGSETVTKMSLSYKVNDGPAVTEEFTVSLAPSTDTTIAFSRKADLSEAGKTYTVSVSCSAEGETDTTNNEGSARVTHFTPVESLPFVINTNEEAGQNQLGFDSEAWNYGEVVGFGNWFADPLVTRCMPLKGGQTYRFSFDRKTGVDLGMMQLPESFWVVYAPAGSEDWDILKFYEADYTSGVYVHDELLVRPASDGNYSFGIVPDANCCNASLFISRMSVESVEEHDVLLSAMTTTLAKRTPARHAQTPMFNVTVVNRGLNTEKVKVTVKNGDKEVGSSEMTIKKSDTAYYSIKGNIAGIEPGEVNLHFEATMAETDANPYNNTMDWKFTATDSLYAFDKDTTYARAMTSQYVIGHIFTLSEPDTLVALMLGWFPLEKTVQFGVEIYPVEEEIGNTDYHKAGENLYSGEFERQAEGGMEMLKLPRVGLPKGRYFIGLKRLDPTLLHVGFDEQPQGKFYMLHQNTLYPNVEYGYIALRALFGKTGTVTANDMDLMLSSQITSYPNPVSGLWTVTAYGLEINRVEIFNITGSSVYRSAGNLATDTWSLDMAGFKPGLYVARVYTNAGVQAIKVLVR